MMQDQFSEKRVEQQPLTIDPANSAVLVVDMLNEFLEDGGLMVLPGGEVLYPPIRQLLETAHTKDMPVFWLNQRLQPDDTLFNKRVVHCIAGSWGADIVDALPQRDTDIIVPKRRYSGFFQTDLDLHLRERNIKSVIVTGVVTNICVRSTVNDAFFLGYEVVVPPECVAATSAALQEAHLYDIDTHYGSVRALDDVLALLNA
ncbi:MAG: isochorismatase family cysteine hydrolase [Chloroflexota bacterium]